MNKLKLVSKQEIAVSDVTKALSAVLGLMHNVGTRRVEGVFVFHDVHWTYSAYIIRLSVGPHIVRIDLREGT